ncbi:MAG: S-layer homology domain-containing protein [archaeon]|nr:S-layer homology domain-containing protein [archaeon]
MKKHFSKFIAFVLSFVMLFTSIPMIGHAATTRTSIDNIDIRGVYEPVNNALYVSDACDTSRIKARYTVYPNTIQAPEVTCTNITWFEGSKQLKSGDKFAPDKEYKLVATCEVTENIRFTNNMSATVEYQKADCNFISEDKIQIIKNYSTSGLKIPNVTLTKGDNFQTKLPSGLQAGDEVQIPLVISNTSDKEFKNYEFTITNINNTTNRKDSITSKYSVNSLTNGSRDLTYNLVVTDLDNSAKRVYRKIKTTGTYRNVGSTDVKYDLQDFVIDIPLTDDGSLGYIDEVEIYMTKPVIGQKMPTFGTGTPDYECGQPTWRQPVTKDSIVTENSQYSVTFYVYTDYFDGVFGNKCKVTVNGEQPSVVTGQGTDTLQIQYSFYVGKVGDTSKFTVSTQPEKGGKVEISKMEYKEGDNVTFKVTTNEGYRFEDISVGSKKYTDTSFTYTCKNYDEIVYLHFTPLTKITYDPGEGQGTKYSVWQDCSEEFELPQCTFKKPGYDFDYWELQQGSGIKVEGKYKIEGGRTDEHVFKAIWKEAKGYNVNVKVNPSDAGTVTLSKTKLELNDEVTVKASPKKGYALDYIMAYDKKYTTNTATIKLTKEEDLNITVYFKEDKKTDTPYSGVSDWAKEEVDKSIEEGLLPESLMGENLTNNISRDEFCQIAVKLYEDLSGKKATAVKVNPFTDTTSQEILKAYNLGITTGTSETTFEPTLEIDRQQMATMMTRAIKAAKIDVTNKNTTKFDDDANIDSWAHDGVYYMNSKGIIKGVGERVGYGSNCFGPKEKSTREQALLIAIRAVETLKK